VPLKKGSSPAVVGANIKELRDSGELPASYSVLEEPKVWLGRRRVPSYYVTLTVNEMADSEMVDDLVHRCNEAALAIRESLMNPGNHNGLQLGQHGLGGWVSSCLRRRPRCSAVSKHRHADGLADSHKQDPELR
jgi:hypothetical protein